MASSEPHLRIRMCKKEIETYFNNDCQCVLTFYVYEQQETQQRWGSTVMDAL
jgi:hypothetical protein